MFRGLYLCYFVVLCNVEWCSGAVGGSDLLLPYSLITLALHNTIILIITHLYLSTPISINQLKHRYTGSRDRTIKVWAIDGDGVQGSSRHKLIRTLTGHAHRINTMALNCDYVLRT